MRFFGFGKLLRISAFPSELRLLFKPQVGTFIRMSMHCTFISKHISRVMITAEIYLKAVIFRCLAIYAVEYVVLFQDGMRISQAVIPDPRRMRCALEEFAYIAALLIFVLHDALTHPDYRRSTP